MATEQPIRLNIVGAGWRAEFFARVAAAAPDRFQVSGIVTRDPERKQRFAQTWGIPAHDSVAELLHAAPADFTVVSVPRAISPDLIVDLVNRGMPVLAETPPATTLADLVALYQRLGPDAPVQVAEQYQFQPLHAARLALVASGVLGTVSQVQFSVAHEYHGLSLIRKLLGLGFENATISARRFVSPIIDGPGRAGGPDEERVVQSEQVIAQLDFGDKFAVYDFCGDQYFSWIRGQRVLVRGERGELIDKRLRYLVDYRTPVVLDLHREDAGRDGNLEGLFHKGILAGAEWVYRNPLAPARLTDDEIAVGTCLLRMARFVATGESFCSLAEASQDHYLGLAIAEALERGAPVTTTTQPWAPA